MPQRSPLVARRPLYLLVVHDGHGCLARISKTYPRIEVQCRLTSWTLKRACDGPSWADMRSTCSSWCFFISLSHSRGNWRCCRWRTSAMGPMGTDTFKSLDLVWSYFLMKALTCGSCKGSCKRSCRAYKGSRSVSMMAKCSFEIC